MLRRLAVLIALLVCVPASFHALGQKPANAAAAAAQPNAAPAAADGSGAPDAGASQTPQVIVNPPATPTPEWTWYERVAWGAGIILAVLGYAGIMLGLRTLKHIDRNHEVGTATAQAALEAANAALSLSQAIANSERPWIVVTVEPFLTVESSFKVMAANRGRSPARIVASVDQVKVAVDETRLPKVPEFENAEAQKEESEPIVLLPGEATGIWAFNREDLPAICKSSDVLKRVEQWQETLFLYGRITYSDLNAPTDAALHDTYWCCRYIHGEKSSALVMAGRPEYNKHT